MLRFINNNLSIKYNSWESSVYLPKYLRNGWHKISEEKQKNPSNFPIKLYRRRARFASYFWQKFHQNCFA